MAKVWWQNQKPEGFQLKSWLFLFSLSFSLFSFFFIHFYCPFLFFLFLKFFLCVFFVSLLPSLLSLPETSTVLPDQPLQEDNVFVLLSRPKCGARVLLAPVLTLQEGWIYDLALPAEETSSPVLGDSGRAVVKSIISLDCCHKSGRRRGPDDVITALDCESTRPSGDCTGYRVSLKTQNINFQKLYFKYLFNIN